MNIKMSTVQHRVLKIVLLFVFRFFFGLCGVAAYSLVGLYDPVLASVRIPYMLFDNLSDSCVGLRVSLFEHAHLLLVLEEALHGRSVSFHADPFHLLPSCLFGIPQSFFP